MYLVVTVIECSGSICVCLGGSPKNAGSRPVRYHGRQSFRLNQGFSPMELLERILDKLREWTEQLIDVLLGPDAQPEAQAIPVPVHDRRR